MADDIPLLLGRATSAMLSIERIDRAQLNCVREFELFEEQLRDIEKRIVFNSQSMVVLQNEISPLLSTLRIMQDAVPGLISRALQISLPSSLSDLGKKLDNYGLAQDLQDLIASYWANGGERLRAYRVLDQHFTGLSHHVFLQLVPDRRVLLLFPDNPKVRAKSGFTYEQQICGISVVRIGFDEIHELIESIAQYFGFDPGRLEPSTRLEQLGDLTPFRPRLLSFSFEASRSQPGATQSQVNISGIRLSQLSDGKIEVQKLLLPKEKLDEMNG